MYYQNLPLAQQMHSKDSIQYFYAEDLGANQHQINTAGLASNLGEIGIEIAENPPPPPPPKFRKILFVTDNVMNQIIIKNIFDQL